ncbi:hypothetical protein EC9_21520 [Rosistilla ulvae]|uniref:Uncharacterized protein n=1 Tax=Rosistilla ulvae TaxID=1930277 RepID=A0A517LZB9_9BACT|nr:hypothetical protein EC9_21520 [Rosistilla ulvae]
MPQTVRRSPLFPKAFGVCKETSRCQRSIDAAVDAMPMPRDGETIATVNVNASRSCPPAGQMTISPREHCPLGVARLGFIVGCKLPKSAALRGLRFEGLAGRKHRTCRYFVMSISKELSPWVTSNLRPLWLGSRYFSGMSFTGAISTTSSSSIDGGCSGGRTVTT